MTDEAEAILERLPELLKQRPQLRYRLFEVLSENYSLRAETNRLLDELKTMREESNRRFDAAQKERVVLGERTDGLKHGFDDLKHSGDVQFKDLKHDFRDLKHSVDVQVGGFARRAGKGLEEAIAGTLRLALGVNDLDPSTIRMRETLVDDEGMIGPPKRGYEYDIVVRNGETWIFEVKSTADEEDVDRFADKCDLVTAKLHLSRPRRIIVTLAPTPELEARCRARGVELA